MVGVLRCDNRPTVAASVSACRLHARRCRWRPHVCAWHDGPRMESTTANMLAPQQLANTRLRAEPLYDRRRIVRELLTNQTGRLHGGHCGEARGFALPRGRTACETDAWRRRRQGLGVNYTFLVFE